MSYKKDNCPHCKRMIDDSIYGVLPNRCPFCNGKIVYGKAGAKAGIEFDMLWFQIKPLLKIAGVTIILFLVLAFLYRGFYA